MPPSGEPAPGQAPLQEAEAAPERPMAYYTAVLSRHLSMFLDRELFPQELDRLNKAAGEEAQKYMDREREEEREVYEEYTFHTEEDDQGKTRLIGTLVLW